MGGLTLATVAVVMRRLLGLGPPKKAVTRGGARLDAESHAIYESISHEIEAHTTILGITLDDAFGERDARRDEMAWHVVRLALGEWLRLFEVLSGLHNVLGKFLPSTSGIVPARRVAVGHFKSRAVIDNVRLYEFLDQVLFSSKRRFALQLRLLSRAAALLTKEFKHACREGERTLDASNELWSRMDFNFHDFDLIAKETLLALRTLLACQSPEGAPQLILELQVLLERSTRVSISPSNH